MNTEDNNINNSKTYEDRFYSKKNKPKNMKNNIPIHKNSELNIITKEKYKEIIGLINTSNYKSNKTEISSSPSKLNSNKVNYKKENIEKKSIYKSKSNINFNKEKSKFISFASIKRKSNKINYSNRIKNISKDKKDQLVIEDKLCLEEYEFKIPEKYKNKKYTLIETLETNDKIINIYNDNKKEIFFPSGVRKEIFNDGYQIVYFVNGDIKQNYPDGKSVYYFNEAKTVQTTFNNGVSVYKFGNNQLERHYPNGKKQILFPDGTERIILDNGYEETHYKDGTILKTNDDENE